MRLRVAAEERHLLAVGALAHEGVDLLLVVAEGDRHHRPELLLVVERASADHRVDDRGAKEGAVRLAAAVVHDAAPRG